MSGQDENWTSEDQGYFNQGMDELFGILFDRVDVGDVSLGQVERFFPDDVQERSLQTQGGKP